MCKYVCLFFDVGPGCLSIGAGAFVEHGPFRPNGDSGNVVKNEYSWNRDLQISNFYLSLILLKNILTTYIHTHIFIHTHLILDKIAYHNLSQT